MWKISAKYPRDIVTEDGKLVCTTYGSDAEENARWIVANQREIREELRDRQRQTEGEDLSPEAT